MARIVAARVGLQVLEGAPVLHDDLAHPVVPEEPDSGRACSSLIIFGMARKIGSHLCTFQGLLIRIPIRKTTNSPSICAAMRLSITLAIVLTFVPRNSAIVSATSPDKAARSSRC